MSSLPSPSRSALSAENIDRCVAFVVAVAAAAAISLALWAGYPNELRAHTDIIGYPAFAGFNVQQYFVGYLLIVVVFPVASIAGYHLARAVTRRRRGRPGPRAPLLPLSKPIDDDDAAGRELGGAGASIARVIVVGALWAAATAITVDAGAEWLGVILVPIVLLVAGATVLAATRLPRWRRLPFTEAVAAVNAISGSLLLFALLVVSQGAEIIELDTGTAVSFPFLPAAAVAAIAATVAVLVARAAWRAVGRGAFELERRVLLYVVGPVALFLLLANLPGEIFVVDLFHDGERLGASELVRDGNLPWRDLLFPHGLLHDVLFPLLDEAAFEHSHWGHIAGTAVLEDTLFWLSVYLLFVYLFRSNWLFLIASLLVIVLGWVSDLGLSRLVLEPVVLLTLAALLNRATWPRAAGFAAATVGQAVLVPEAIVFSLAAWAAVIGYELIHRRGGDPATLAGSRTARSAVSAAALAAAFAIYLLLSDSLDSFVDYYRTFVGGHDLTGGIPIQWSDFTFGFWVIAPLVVVLAAWWYATARIRSRRWFTTPEWVVGAAILGLIPYYAKFLSRADSAHLFQVATAALIPLLYLIYRALEAGDRRLGGTARRFVGAHPLSAIFAAAVLLLAPASLFTKLRDLPGQLSAEALAAPTLPQLGYVSPDAVPDSLIADMQVAVDALAGSDGTVFDFTNSPALFGPFVDVDVATRFYHVSMAIPADSQRQLIGELEADRPEVVVLSSSGPGLPIWDGVANYVRHYEVSDYLLDHYRPVGPLDGYVLMLRSDLRPPPPSSLPETLESRRSTSDLYFGGPACDWGYAPEYLDARPADADAVDLPLRRSRDAGIDGFRLELPDDARRFDWLELRIGGGIPSDRFVIWDGGADPARAIAFSTHGSERESVLVRVGSCPQWHGYAGRRVYIASASGARPLLALLR